MSWGGKGKGREESEFTSEPLVDSYKLRAAEAALLIALFNSSREVSSAKLTLCFVRVLNMFQKIHAYHKIDGLTESTGSSRKGFFFLVIMGGRYGEEDV